MAWLDPGDARRARPTGAAVSDAHAALVAEVRRTSLSEVANRVGLPYSTVRNHVLGLWLPDAWARAAYARVLGIVDTWGPPGKRGRPRAAELRAALNE